VRAHAAVIGGGGQQRGDRQLVVVAIQQLAGRTDGLRTALRESYLQFKDYHW
jgi:hypothetical protein